MKAAVARPPQSLKLLPLERHLTGLSKLRRWAMQGQAVDHSLFTLDSSTPSATSSLMSLSESDSILVSDVSMTYTSGGSFGSSPG